MNTSGHLWLFQVYFLPVYPMKNQSGAIFNTTKYNKKSVFLLLYQ